MEEFQGCSFQVGCEPRIDVPAGRAVLTALPSARHACQTPLRTPNGVQPPPHTCGHHHDPGVQASTHLLRHPRGPPLLQGHSNTGLSIPCRQPPVFQDFGQDLALQGLELCLQVFLLEDKASGAIPPGL